MTADEMGRGAVPRDAGSRGVVVFAFGDPDDHLRLSTLIADTVVRRAPSPVIRGVARRLTDERGPRSWRDRRNDFVELLDRLPAGLVTLSDPDAFASAVHRPTDDWDDASSARERADFFGLVLQAAGRSALMLHRTAPDPSLSDHLADTASDIEPVHPEDEWAGSVAPEVRRVLDWLLEGRHLTTFAVEELLEETRGPELYRHLVLVAFDTLAPSTRDAAYRVATLRGEQNLNGMIGPFPTSGRGECTVPSAKVDALVECGFLWREGARVRMPRTVREVVLGRARAEAPEQVEQEHRWVASQLDSRGDDDIEQHIECHHHAVRGLDREMAVRTARFYATDLRELGIRLSAKARWTEAADTYRAILRFDRADAYAWEYLAYNLARQDARAHAKDILDAYERAQELEPNNPLYHGRLVGFRAFLGVDVEGELRAGVGAYRYRGLDRFACEILKGMLRGGRQPEVQRIVQAYPALTKFREVRTLLRQAG